MKMLFNAFGKKLFGERYERLIKNIFLNKIILILFSSYVCKNISIDKKKLLL